MLAAYFASKAGSVGKPAGDAAEADEEVARADEAAEGSQAGVAFNTGQSQVAAVEESQI